MGMFDEDPGPDGRGCAAVLAAIFGLAIGAGAVLGIGVFLLIRMAFS